MKHFVQRINDQRSFTFELITSRSPDGSQRFSYTLFKKDVFESLQQRAKRESIDLNEHGIVIYEGAGIPTQDDEAKAIQIFNEECLAS